MFTPALRRTGVALTTALCLLAGACAPEAMMPREAEPVSNNHAAPAPAPAPVLTTPPQVEQVELPPVAPPPETVSVEPAPETTQEEVLEEVASEPLTTVDPVVTPTVIPLLELGDDNDQVRELQHRLLQLNWFEGKITSTYGEGTKLAVEGFQGKRGLPATGEVDQATWDKLVDMSRQPTHDEMYNIMKPGPALLATGSTGDQVKDLQARLKQLKWYFEKIDGIYGPKTAEAVKGFQEKREIPVTGEVDQRTLDRLHGMSRKPTTDELNNVAPKPKAKSKTMTLDDRCLQGRVVCVSKTQRKLAWVIDGQIQMVMDVRFGSSKTPTRNGVFSIGWKSRNHHSKLYDSPMPYALFFSGGQAVHYSSDFAARGYAGASKGCVNVRDKAAVEKLFEATRTGDKVVVYVG